MGGSQYVVKRSRPNDKNKSSKNLFLKSGCSSSRLELYGGTEHGSNPGWCKSATNNVGSRAEFIFLMPAPQDKASWSLSELKFYHRHTFRQSKSPFRSGRGGLIYAPEGALFGERGAAGASLRPGFGSLGCVCDRPVVKSRHFTDGCTFRRRFSKPLGCPSSTFPG